MKTLPTLPLNRNADRGPLRRVPRQPEGRPVKKRLTARALGKLLLGVLPAACLSLSAPAAQVVIKLGTVAPEGSVWHDALLHMRQQWRNASNGQVELRIYAGGVLGSEEELVRKLERHAIDAAALSVAGLPVLDNSFGCLNVPMLFGNDENLAYVSTGITPRIEQIVEQKGFKVLSWAPAGWVQIFSKQVTRTPDDLRRQRVWTSAGDPDIEVLYKALGFRAVPLPATDLLTSLQTGLVDAVPVLPLFALLDRSYTVANHMTVINWSPLISSTVISMQAWNRIPPDLRPKLLTIAHTQGEALGVLAVRAGDAAVREMQTRGLQVIRPSEAELNQWRTESEKSYPAYRGKACPAALFDEVIRLDKGFDAHKQDAR